MEKTGIQEVSGLQVMTLFRGRIPVVCVESEQCPSTSVGSASEGVASQLQKIVETLIVSTEHVQASLLSSLPRQHSVILLTQHSHCGRCAGHLEII